MKSIILAEKPSVGKELARILDCGKKTKGYAEGRDYIVTWAMGHLVELADPHVYDEKLRSWSLDTLPMLPDRMKHSVIRKTSHQFRIIKGLFQREDTKKLIIATDAGREGELVARWIMRLGSWKGPFQRLWISSQTDTAIREGFQNLKPGQDYDNLFRAAECRAEADWIIGLNITRALSCKHDTRLSAGRVQTPTLAMIIQREKEIDTFQPESYWQVLADFGDFTGIWIGHRGSNESGRIKDQKLAGAIADKVKGAEAIIAELKQKEKSDPPPLAYNLTSLQAAANRILGFSARKTLNVMQSLYERHKILSYPRTDSRHITLDIVPTLKNRLRAIRKSSCRNAIDQLLSQELKPGKRFVDDSKVSDHHAIIPTEEPVNPDSLSTDEKAIWNLVVRCFVAVLFPPYRYRSINLITEAAGEHFVTHGIQLIDPGWKKVERVASDQEQEEQELPRKDISRYKKGEKLTVVSSEVKQCFTKPPLRYSEGILLEAMENAGRFVEDTELRKSIAKGGIGTPATRADIIEKLLSNYYIERKGKSLVPTPKGYALLELVPEQLNSPELTARWEQRLERIAEGKERADSFSRDIRENARTLVEHVKLSPAKYNPQNLSTTPCPVCSRLMLPVLDKKGRKILTCQALSCGYEQSERDDNSLSRKPSRKEKSMTRRMIGKYSDHSKETSTFADLIEAALKRKEGKK